MRKAVKIIAIVYSVLAGFAFFGYCIALFTGRVAESLASILVLAISLILLWSLSYALDKIDNLETDVIVLQRLLSKKDEEKSVEKDGKPYKKCKVCGAIERTNADCCPMCNTPYETNGKSKQKK